MAGPVNLTFTMTVGAEQYPQPTFDASTNINLTGTGMSITGGQLVHTGAVAGDAATSNSPFTLYQPYLIQPDTISSGNFSVRTPFLKSNTNINGSTALFRTGFATNMTLRSTTTNTMNGLSVKPLTLDSWTKSGDTDSATEFLRLNNALSYVGLASATGKTKGIKQTSLTTGWARVAITVYDASGAGASGAASSGTFDVLNQAGISCKNISATSYTTTTFDFYCDGTFELRTNSGADASVFISAITWNYYPSAVISSPAVTLGSELQTNPALTGTGGSLQGGGATGTVATSWIGYSSGSATFGKDGSDRQTILRGNTNCALYENNTCSVVSGYLYKATATIYSVINNTNWSCRRADGTLSQFANTGILPGQHVQYFTAANTTTLSNYFYQAVDGNGATISSASLKQVSDVTSYNYGDSVSFASTGSSDVEDGLTYAWTSSLDGALSTSASFSKSNLSVGRHLITLTVTDSGGLTNSAYNMVVINGRPTATITAPASGTWSNYGANVSLEGYGTDAEDGTLTGASIAWTSDIDGALGTGSPLVKNNLTAGTHTITLTATDSNGATGATNITLNINARPVVTITSPATSPYAANAGVSVNFACTATDAEDGSLSGASVVWTSSVDGTIGTGTSFSKSNLTAGVSHTITCTATDSRGFSGNNTTIVRINAFPVANITGPAQVVYDSGATVNFTGTGTDSEDGALTGASLQWTSSLDGSIGSGISVSTTLSDGVHTITLTATDSEGASGTDTMVILMGTKAASSSNMLMTMIM